jgi:hypothetical protein
MFRILEEKPSMIRAGEDVKFLPHPILQVLIFFGIFIVAQLVTLPLGIMVGVIGVIVAKGDVGVATSLTSQYMVILMLFSTLIVTGVYILYAKLVEKRSMYSMGFVRQNALKQYGIGLLTGLIAISACVFIACITGAATFDGIAFQGGAIFIFLMFIGFLLQGANEEILFRGYLMVNLANKKTVLFAVIVNSILFALLHMMNAGISVLAVLNLTLYGVLASLYTLKTNNIWGVSAFHSIWNFAQGNLFGIKVSGLDTGASIFSVSFLEKGSLINGGSFGIEGGIACTIVLTLGIIFLIIKSQTLLKDVNEGTLEE